MDRQHEPDIVLAGQVEVAQDLREERHVDLADDIHRLHAARGMSPEHEAHRGHALTREEVEPVVELLLRGVDEGDQTPTLFPVLRQANPVRIEAAQRQPTRSAHALLEVALRAEDNRVASRSRSDQADGRRGARQALIVADAELVHPALGLVTAPGRRS